MTMPNVDIPQGINTGGSPRRQETIGGTFAQTRSKSVLEQPNEPPLTKGHTSRSEEGRMEHTVELMDTVPPTPHDSPLTGELAKETSRQEQEKFNLEKALELQRKLDKREEDVDK
nr:hypothetical protein [Tanacetum cinerariifolium]